MNFSIIITTGVMRLVVCDVFYRIRPLKVRESIVKES